MNEQPNNTMDFLDRPANEPRPGNGSTWVVLGLVIVIIAMAGVAATFWNNPVVEEEPAVPVTSFLMDPTLPPHIEEAVARTKLDAAGDLQLKALKEYIDSRFEVLEAKEALVDVKMAHQDELDMRLAQADAEVAIMKASREVDDMRHQANVDQAHRDNEIKQIQGQCK